MCIELPGIHSTHLVFNTVLASEGVEVNTTSTGREIMLVAEKTLTSLDMEMATTGMKESLTGREIMLVAEKTLP